MGRALALGAECAETLTEQQSAAFLAAAACRLSSGEAAIQTGALRCIHALLDHVTPALLHQAAGALYTGLGAMLETAVEEQLHGVLEALAALVEATPSADAALEGAIAPHILTVWRANITDPLITSSALEVFSSLAKNAKCLSSLQERVVPHLAAIIAAPREQAASLVEQSLELLATLLRPSSREGSLSIHAAVTPAVITILNTSDDNTVLQSCCEYLRCLLRAAGETLLTAGPAPALDTFREMMTALARLLAPDVGDQAAMYVGPALLALLAVAPPEAAAAIPPLLQVLVTKVSVAESTLVITGLLTVVAKLMSSHMEDCLACLSGLPSPTDDSRSALEALMKVWVERHLDFSGRVQINLSAAALAAMLCAQSCPLLDQIQVKGRRLDTSTVPRTRSQAAKQSEQWDTIPLRLKLFVITVDALQEVAAQGASQTGAESDSSWEADESGSGSGEDYEGNTTPFEVASTSLEKIIARAAAEEAADSDDEEDADFQGEPAAAIDLEATLSAALIRFMTLVPAASSAVEYLTPSQTAAVTRLRSLA